MNSIIALKMNNSNILSKIIHERSSNEYNTQVVLKNSIFKISPPSVGFNPVQITIRFVYGEIVIRRRIISPFS